MIVVLTFGTVSLAAAIAYGCLLLNLRRSQERIVERVEGAVQRLAAKRAAPAAPAPVAPPTAEVTSARVRIAQDFTLPALDGRMVSLRDLLAVGKPVLLNLTDPKCGPCYELLSDISGWERVYGDRLTFATLSGGDLAQNRLLAREYGLGTVLLQRDHEIADALGLPMIPGALLITPDGQIKDSTTGSHRVRELVANALGMAVPPQPAQAAQAAMLRVGQKVGELRLPDLDGNLIDLGARRAEPTALLFWSPGCTHCRDLLPTMRGWEADPNGPRLVIVTSGPVGLNREAGLTAPMILDDEGVLKRTFGVRGTPAAVLIDGNGRVASEVGRGATMVRALVAQRFPAPTAA